jgi:hypothetical protein
MPKFDKKTRDKIYKHLRMIALKYENEILPQCWSAVLSKTKPSITVSAAVRKEFAKALYDMMMFFFKQSYKGAKVQIRETVVNASDIPDDLLNAMQGAYVEKAKTYGKWITDVATKLEKQRFKDTVTRAESIVKASIEQGLTRVQMREALQTKFEDYNEYSLDRVITTEGTRAMNLGTVASTTDDDNIIGYRVAVNYTGCSVCDSHMEDTAGDNYIPKEDLTPADCPPFHPSCECSLEPVFKSDI